MPHLLASLVAVDDLCRDLAIAIQHSEWQIYGALAAVLTLAFLTFPPRSDSGQP